MPGLPWPAWGQADDVSLGDGWVQAAHLHLAKERVPAVIAAAWWVGVAQTWGALPVTLGDAFFPAGLGVVEDKSRLLPLHWDLPVGLDFS